jgi:hypothetical protein
VEVCVGAGVATVVSTGDGNGVGELVTAGVAVWVAAGVAVPAGSAVAVGACAGEAVPRTAAYIAAAARPVARTRRVMGAARSRAENEE